MSEQGGPLLPVVVSGDTPQGGPAQRVMGYTTAPAGRGVAGGPAQPVYVVSAGELASGVFVAVGNPVLLPLIAVTDGRPVAGQKPIPVVVVSGSLNPSPGGASYLLAENGNYLTTEAGDRLILET